MTAAELTALAATVLASAAALGSAYLVVAALVAVAAEAGVRGARRLERLTPVVLRRMARAVVGVGMAATTATGTIGALVHTAGADTGSVAVMRRLPEEPTSTTSSPPSAETPQTVADGASPAPVLASGPSGPVADTWVVQPGDHLWSIAERVVARSGPAPDREVARYWRRLVDAAEPHLVEPGNPDLILPGQRLPLPRR